jgi:P-type Cu2+ transporter
MADVKKISIPVTGMACAACAVSVQSMLQSQTGVVSASVNYGNKTVRLEYNESLTSLTDLKKIIQGIGYDLFLDEEDRAEKLELIEQRRFISLSRKLWVAALFSLPVFVISMFFHHAFPNQDYLLLMLSLPVIIYSGSEFYPSAYRQLLHRVFAMDSLVATGTGAAFLFSAFNTFFPAVMLNHGLEPQVYYESAVIIIAFILLGRYLEENAKNTASSAIRKLTGLQPKVVLVQRDGETFELPALLVIPGDRVSIKAGDRIPVDGKVINGTSAVDESSITGEPLPVFKEAGSMVFAGTINQQGLLLVEALKPGNETMLSHIIRLVDEAQSSKPPIQKLVDKIAGIFVPVVFLIAILTFTGWMVFGESLSHAVVTTISVLIIACPCALGLATPMALIAGIGRGAGEGILIRNASALEAACKIDTVLLDKTGTLTSGKPTVISLHWFPVASEKDKALLLSLESRSNHPLAKAVKQYLEKEENLVDENPSTYDQFSEIAGKGIRASLDGNTWIAGNLALVKESGIQQNELRELPGVSKVYFACNAVLLAEISISDELKSNAASSILQLRKSGIEAVMVSGDNKETAQLIAESAGINRVYAPVLPEEKGNLVKLLQSEGKNVAMIGDGINDAYALAQADLGIAMGSGTDIAIESAGIVLMQSDLGQAVKALHLSRAVVSIIHQNLFWAFFYNLVAIPLAAGLLYPFTGFLLSPMIAGAAMAMSSVTVVTNSLRLRKMKLA